MNLYLILYRILVNKCNGSYDNMNEPYAKLCVPDVAKDINIKVFNLLSRNNETRLVSRHENYVGKCRLDATVLNNKQH